MDLSLAPYPLTNLEHRALTEPNSQWRLVRHPADGVVYFYNASTKEATRHLQPLLLKKLDAAVKLQSATPNNPSLGYEDAGDVAALRTAMAAMENELLLLRYAVLTRSAHADESNGNAITTTHCPAVSFTPSKTPLTLHLLATAKGDDSVTPGKIVQRPPEDAASCTPRGGQSDAATSEEVAALRARVASLSSLSCRLLHEAQLLRHENAMLRSAR